MFLPTSLALHTPLASVRSAVVATVVPVVENAQQSTGQKVKGVPPS